MRISDWSSDVCASDLNVSTDGSLVSSQEGVALTNDEDSPGANQVYGTDGDGNKGWKDDPGASEASVALKADITSVIGLQDLFIPASAMWPRTTSGFAALAKTEMTTSLVNIQSLDFDQTTQEFAQFQIVLPRNWNNGTVTEKVYWTAEIEREKG